MDKTKKEELLKGFQKGPKDTGSADVQVAFLTQRISEITDHLREHKQDHHSRRGLFKLVGRRRRLLRYLNREDVQRYRTLIASLGLRR